MLEFELSPSKCFGSVSEDESLLAAKGVVPLNMKVTNEWTLRNLRSWMETCNISVETVSDDLLSCDDAEVVCKWLCRFVQEARKENGENYPLSTIRSLLSAFQKVMHCNKVL